MGTQEDHLTELSDAARRAGSIVNEYIDSIVDAAERQAEEIRQSADREADEVRQTAEREAELARQEALNSAQRVFERINALEQPIGELVQTLRMEMERVGRELESVVDAEAIGIAAESEEVRDQGSTRPSPSPLEAEGRAREPWPPGREPESEVAPHSEQGLQFAEEPAVEEPAVEDSAPIAVEESALESAAPVTAEEPLFERQASAAVDEEPALQEPVAADAGPSFDDPAPGADEKPALEYRAPTDEGPLFEEPAPVDEGSLFGDPAPAADEERAVQDPAPMTAEGAPAVPEETTVEPVPAEPREEEASAAALEPDARSVPSSEANRESEPPVVEEKAPTIFTPAPAPAEENPKSKIRSVFSRSSKAVFIRTQGHCSVCQRTFMAGTEENLRLSGWRVSGDVGLCPECQAGGWQLPDGARLPFRRGGA